MAEKIYYCDGCGGVLEWDPRAQKLKCPNCGNIQEMVNDSDSIIEHTLSLDAKRTIRATEKESHTMECQGCGASMEVGGNETAAKCPYCGSSYVLSQKQEDVLTPDGVIPFQLDKNAVTEKFRNWIKGRWLAPSSLKNLYQHGGFTGIYVPYWTFDADCDCPYDAEGGKERKEHYKDKDGNDQVKTVVDWYPTHGHLHHFFDDVQTPASTRFSGGMLSGLEPYDFNKLVSYDSGYISGYLSENYSIDLQKGNMNAKIKMQSTLDSMAHSEVLRKYDQCRNVRLHPRYSKETYKYALVPVYSTSYRFNDKTYAVVINGQTGVVHGEYPRSPFKIAMIIILIILAIIGIMMLNKGGSGDATMVPPTEPTIEVCDSTHEYVMDLEDESPVIAEYDDIVITL